MFRSTALRLTVGYTAILILACLVFDIPFYQLSVQSTSEHLQHIQNEAVFRGPPGTPPMTQQDQARFDTLRQTELKADAHTLIQHLAIYNVAVLVVGVVASYWLTRRTLRSVEEAHLAQTRFVSDASHELRTPLAAMKSEMEVALRDKRLSADKLRLALRSNLEEVEGLTRMTETLLTMSRLEHAKLPKQPLDLKLTVAEASYRFRQSNGRLSLTGKNGVMVEANEPSLIELFTILIDNALKYSPADSKVVMKVSTHEDQAMFEISNQGPAIAPEALNHLFERFYRADSARTHSGVQQGFGLGLSIAKQIADMHHATVRVESITGKRTVFRVFFQKINKVKDHSQN